MTPPTINFYKYPERLRLLHFVEVAHKYLTSDGEPQVRKYTGEPYHYHPIEVANLYYEFCDDGFGIEIALCHDLIEDTIVTEQFLYEALLAFGYIESVADAIVIGVVELTDVFTKENYPELNRKARKAGERERQARISELSQTIKYCDNINNAYSIVVRDEGFAKVYMAEIRENLKTMNKGNETLYSTINRIVEDYFNNTIKN